MTKDATRHEWHELKDASKTAPYCIACVGDGWMSGEWDTCPRCFGTGREITDDQRRIYRCRTAERESRESANRLEAAKAEHATNMAKLDSAQEALFEAARLAKEFPATTDCRAKEEKGAKAQANPPPLRPSAETFAPFAPFARPLSP